MAEKFRQVNRTEYEINKQSNKTIKKRKTQDNIQLERNTGRVKMHANYKVFIKCILNHIK